MKDSAISRSINSPIPVFRRVCALVFLMLLFFGATMGLDALLLENDPSAIDETYDPAPPVDPVNGLVVVPHLFGSKGGPNPYWAKYDWDLAIQDGQAYTGQPYSGTYGFASTEMLLSVNHEVAPKEQALGSGPAPDNCMDCHVGGGVEWDELGWTGDPLSGGQRVDGGESVMLDRPAPTRMD